MGNVSLKVFEKSLKFLFKKGYEPCVWHFFTNDIFEIKYPWTGRLLWQLSRLLQNFLTTLYSGLMGRVFTACVQNTSNFCSIIYCFTGVGYITQEYDQFCNELQH